MGPALLADMPLKLPSPASHAYKTVVSTRLKVPVLTSLSGGGVAKHSSSKCSMDIICLILSIFLSGLVAGQLSVSSAAKDEERTLTRRKRYLIFPQGSNVQLVYCLTIGAYARPGDLVIGLTAALAWELPSKIDEKLTGLLHRRTRAVMYPKIEAFLQSTGLDGRSCVMRALCEAGQRSASEIESGTFLQELLHAVFTIRKDGEKFDNEDSQQYDYAHGADGNCSELYPSCEHSIYSLDF